MAKVFHGDASNEQLAVTSDAQAYGLKGSDTIVSGGKQDVLPVGVGSNISHTQKL